MQKGEADSNVDASENSRRFAEAFRLQKEGRFHRAAEIYFQLSRLTPGDPAVFNNLGNCLRSLGEYEKSIQCYNEALKLEPGRSSSLLNRGMALLALGRYLEAWEDYESRLDVIEFRRDLLERSDEKWQGESLGGNGVLYLFGNQGLGDEIQCFRFLEEAASRVGQVILELQRPMMPLARDLPDNVAVIQRGDDVPAFDRWAELFSLPRLFGISIENVPDPVGFSFDRDAGVIDAMSSDAKSRDAFKVGLVWSGNPGNSLNGVRACGLGHLEKLLSVDSCRFFSLQLGAPSSEIEQRGLGDRIVDLGPHLKDFASTATAIEELDLLITTDTSVPHLAGSMGADSWVLLHRPADWRWGQQGERCAWYPSLRLFRQERMRDWGPVVEEVKSALEQRVAGHQP